MTERVSLPLLCAGLLLLAGCGGSPAATTAPVSSPPAETVQAAPSPSPTPAATPTPTPTETAAAAETELPAETPADPGWTALDTGSSFGRASGTGGALVVYAVQADEDGLTVTLAPLPNEADVTAFQETEEALPAGTVDYWSDAGALVLKLENTVLSSGEIGGDDWLHDFLREGGLEYPMSTPMGAVPGSCPDFEKAAISSDGANTTISLIPLGSMTEYQVTPLGVDGLTVSFRLALQ
ncbi:hypothetical protein [uncultured Intestinimonas sp.]|uniref:hypothetical protein n=1 Tax=uncultured Intestinimonas sp. TaxID=1689265 RepID=UPI0025D9C2BF|nr:hypothetical protein [uncultured Intestinimonas sp.]